VRPREATTTTSSGGGDAVFRPISAELPAYQGFSQQPPIVTASRWPPRPTAQGPGWGRVKKILPGHGVSGVSQGASRRVSWHWPP